MFGVFGINTGFGQFSRQARPHRVQTSPWVNVGGWERVASGLGAGYMMSRMARRPRRRSLMGAMLGGLGLMLLNRSLSGHCMVYKRAGMSSVRDEWMMD